MNRRSILSNDAINSWFEHYYHKIPDINETKWFSGTKTPKKIALVVKCISVHMSFNWMQL